MGALENPNAINAAAVIVPVPTVSFPEPLVQQRGVQSFTRLSAGQYELVLQFGLCFGDAVPFVSVPANTPFTPGVQVTSPGTVRISVVRVDDQTPADPPAIFFTTLAMETAGVTPELPLLPDPPSADATLDLYLDPVDGDDANTGRSTSQAVQTPLRISELIPLWPGNVDIHMKSGAAVLPARGWFLRARALNGLIRFVADEVWDPAVFTVVGGNRIAGAATTGLVIKDAGLVINALQDLSVRFTTGAASGQYRRIRNNTVTDVIPSTAFDPAPAPGDTYQIFTSNAYFALPALPDGETDIVSDYVFCADSPSVAPLPFDWSGFGYLTMSRPLGVLFDGVGLRGGTGFYRYFFGATSVYFFGTDANTDFQASYDPMGASGGVMYSGYGLPDYVLKQGWGFAGSGGPTTEREQLIGCWHCGDFWYLPEYGVFLGGRYEDAVSPYGGSNTFYGDWVDGSIAPLFGSSAADFCLQLNSPNSVVDLVKGIVLGQFQILYGQIVHMSRDVTGGPLGVAVFWGARLLLNGGAPQLGDAVATDWQVFGVANVNKSFFAAANTIRLGTDGSCAQRVF